VGGGGGGGGRGGGGAALTALRRAGFSGQPNGALLARFRHVVVVGSPQDGYAPAPSCGGYWAEAALADGRRGAAVGEMVRGFWDGVPLRAVTRVDVRFAALPSAGSSGSGSSSGGGSGSGGVLGAVTTAVNSAIGREAHLAFLDTPALGSLLALGLPAGAVPGLWDDAAS
jgi:hypothetical protein